MNDHVIDHVNDRRAAGLTTHQGAWYAVRMMQQVLVEISSSPTEPAPVHRPPELAGHTAAVRWLQQHGCRLSLQSFHSNLKALMLEEGTAMQVGERTYLYSVAGLARWADYVLWCAEGRATRRLPQNHPYSLDEFRQFASGLPGRVD